MDRVKIGIIDNGVDEIYLFLPLQNRVYVNDNGICTEDLETAGNRNQKFQHGTICARIIQKYCPDSNISSIKILDNMGRGCMEKVRPALKWCLHHDIRLVNVSLGTTHFADKASMNQIINECAREGMIIVAATANGELISYPAAFSNVIGVSAGVKFAIDKTLLIQKGVDFVAPVNAEIVRQVDSLGIEGNSYAAPYITALIGKELSNNQTVSIIEIKGKLSELCNEGQENFHLYYTPDWIIAAWVEEEDRIAAEDACFKIYQGDYEQCREEIDTIIFYDRSKLNKYRKEKKNLVYLGKEDVDFLSTGQFYWDWKKRVVQIRNTAEKKGEISLPIIFCVTNVGIDLPHMTLAIKKQFAVGGYNIYAVSTIIESIFYDLEYIPMELLSDNEKSRDFLYWQTYYRRSDAIFIGVFFEDINKVKHYYTDADMVVTLTSIESGFTVEIKCDGDVRKKDYYCKMDCRVLYQDILHLLLEGEDEQ